jgi:hypothetical protein
MYVNIFYFFKIPLENLRFFDYQFLLYRKGTPDLEELLSSPLQIYVRSSALCEVTMDVVFTIDQG